MRVRKAYGEYRACEDWRQEAAEACAIIRGIVGDGGWGTGDGGRWTMDDGRWTMDDGRWTD
ncbi:MAG: hypothetical protein WCD37_17990 [Chloroflexia bacterium]